MPELMLVSGPEPGDITPLGLVSSSRRHFGWLAVVASYGRCADALTYPVRMMVARIVNIEALWTRQPSLLG